MSSSTSGPKRLSDTKCSHGRNSENRTRCRIPQRLPPKNIVRSAGYMEHHDPLASRHQVSPEQTLSATRNTHNSGSPARSASLPWSKTPQSVVAKKPVLARRSPMHTTKNLNRNIVQINYTKKSRSGLRDLPDQAAIQKSEELEIKGELSSDLCVDDVDVRGRCHSCLIPCSKATQHSRKTIRARFKKSRRSSKISRHSQDSPKSVMSPRTVLPFLRVLINRAGKETKNKIGKISYQQTLIYPVKKIEDHLYKRTWKKLRLTIICHRTEKSVTSPRGRIIRMKISWQEQLDKFQVLKKELNERQRDILQLYASLREKHKQMLEHDQKTELPPAEELNIMNVANMTPEQLLALCAETHVTGSTAELPTSLENESLKLDKFYNISTKLIETCKLALAKRKEIIDWIISLKCSEKIPVKIINEKIHSLNAENEQLQATVDRIKSEFHTEIQEIVTHIRKLLHEAISHQLNTENLTYKYSELTGENMNLRKQLYSLEHTRTNRHKLEEMEKELKEEKCKRMVMRDRLSRAENKLKLNKNAMDDLKSHTWALEQAVQQLTEQNQQLQLEFDKDLNKLSDSINENASQLEEIAEAREKLQVEKEELEQRLETLSSLYHEENRNLKNDLKVNIDKLADLDTKYQALLKEKKELVEKCASLNVQLSKKEKAFEDIFNGIKEKEEELLKAKDIQEELEKTKNDLALATQEVECLKLANGQQAAKIHELKNDLRDTMKLESEMRDALLVKDEYIVELEKNKINFEEQIRENEYKMCSYEEQIAKINDHISELQKDYGDFDNLGELTDMVHRQRQQLLEATRENSELAEELQKRDMEIEHIKFSLKQHERALDEKEQINKMLITKEEEQVKLLEVLKNNLELRAHAEQNFEKKLEQKNREIDTILNNLESRKEQICQLEQIVLTLENQKQETEEQLRKDQEIIKMLEKKLNKYEVDNTIESPTENLDSLMKILENELEAQYDAEIKPNRTASQPTAKKSAKRKEKDAETNREVDDKTNATKFMLDNVRKKTILIENHPGTLGSKKDDAKWVPLRGAGIAAYESSVLEKAGMETYLARNLPFIVPRHDKQSRMFKLATHRVPNL